MATHLILLAAGQGTRMQSDLPKVLHEVAGLPLFAHALKSAGSLAPERRIIVLGHGSDVVAAAVTAHDPDAKIVLQAEQRGTGHAVAQAREALAGAGGDTLVLYGDTPFITSDTLTRMTARRDNGAELVVLGFNATDPGRYGRLVTEGQKLVRIVEFKDATPSERAIELCNSGVLLARTDLLFDLVGRLRADNAAGEFYLTDIVEMADRAGIRTEVVRCDESETLGVNSRADLARAEAAFQDRARAGFLASGVTLKAPETIHFSYDTMIGRDAVVEPYVVFGPGVVVGSGAQIRSFSHLENANVGHGSIVGPFARIRPGTEIGKGASIGNFVEIKNAEIGPEAKVNHLSYIGDASVGDRANVGAGTITCNFDGLLKHRTRIGSDAFIGSDTMLVAPVSVGNRAMTASGSVITMNVPDGALGIARSRQENKSGFAQRFFAKLRGQRAKRKE